MSNKRKIEIFSAGCPACEEAIKLVNSIACTSCEIEVLGMHKEDVAAKAKQYEVLADCCAGGGAEVASLRAAGVGVALP